MTIMNFWLNIAIQVVWFLAKIFFFVVLAGYSLNSINFLLENMPDFNQTFGAIIILGTVIVLFWRIHKHSVLFMRNIKSHDRTQIKLDIKSIQSIGKYWNAIKEIPCSMRLCLFTIFFSGLFKIAAQFEYGLNDKHVIGEFELYICANKWLWIVAYSFILAASLWIVQAIVLYEQNYKSLAYSQKLVIIAMFTLIIGAFFRFLFYLLPQ